MLSSPRGWRLGWRTFRLPRNAMSGVEKNAMAFGYYVDRHVEDERS